MAIFRRLKKPDPKKEEQLQNDIEEMGGLEKNDQKAMIIAALITIIPVCLLVLAVMVLFGWLVLGLF